MSWTGWHNDGDGGLINKKYENGWHHVLISTNDIYPDGNHWHFKYTNIERLYLCSVKENGRYVHNRREALRRVQACVVEDIQISDDFYWG